MAELSFRLVLITDDASGKLQSVAQEAEDLKAKVETPKEVKLSAEQALATIRDVKIAVDGVLQVFSGLANGMNQFMDEALAARQAMTLAKLTFGESAQEMSNFANSMQQVTNFEGDKLLALMAKLSMTYKMTGGDIKALTPYLLDFTEANKATGMTVETAFDLMGKALNGHTEMLGRYGIELDDVRLKQEGAAYLVEKLSSEYAGTATALADLRLQNQNVWGDVKESIGDMLQVLITPLLQGLKWLMESYNSLSPVLKGFAAGIMIAIPLVVSITTGIVALTAAVHALKTAINPVAGTIGIIVGLLSAVGFGLASAKLSMDAAGEASETMSQKIGDVNRETDVEVEKFKLLSNRLLEIKNATNATNAEKEEMRGIIKNLNDEYKPYLGNLNLETAGYNEIAAAAKSAAENIAKKKLAEGFGSLAAEQADKVARARLRLDKAMIFSPQEQEDLAMSREGGGQGGGADWAKQIHKQHQDRIDFFTKEYQTEVAEYQRVVKAYTDAMTAADMSITDNTGTGSGSGSTSPLDDEKRRYEDMVKELADLMKSATEKIEEEYKTRLALIQKYTKDGSEEEKKQLADLEAWKTTKIKEAQDKEKELQDKMIADGLAAEKGKFEKQIEYYSNLENLGISTYDALKQTMSDYYAWAKEHLTKEEAALILAQMRESNLRWGKHRADQLYNELEHRKELADINEDFHKKDLELAGNTFALQLQAIDDYYAANKAKLIQAGVTEAQIVAQQEAQKNKIKLDAAAQLSSGTASILNTLANAQDKESEKGFKTWKALATAQALVDIPSSAIAAYKSVVGVPVVGPVLAVAAAAAAVAAGVANLNQISKAKYEKAEFGMYVNGPSHAQGGVPIEVEGGEFITRKERVSALGRSFFEFLNFAPIEAVKRVFSGFSLPRLSVPMPEYAYAGGGSVSNNGIYSLLEQISTKLDMRPSVIVNVDPITGKAVILSELMDEGKMIRSEV